MDETRKFWNFDDITEFGRIDVLNNYVPTTLAALTVAAVGYNMCSRYYKYNVKNVKLKPSLSQELNSNTSDEESPLIGERNGYGTDPDVAETHSSLHDKHFSIRNIKLDDSKGKYHLIRRNTLEIFRTVTELVLVAFQFLLHCSLLLKRGSLGGDLHHFHFEPLVVTWGVLLCLVSLRVLNLKQTNRYVIKYAGSIWPISCANYLAIFTQQILPFRSTLLHHVLNHSSAKYYQLQFWISLILCALLVTSPFRDELPVIFQPDMDRKPSPEPRTSLLSLITYHWVGGYIRLAYIQGGLTLDNIWSNCFEDLAVNVVKDYKKFTERPSMKTARFAVLLLTYFLPIFLLQFSFTAVVGCLKFAPSILLKEILDFIDDREKGSMNLAWFYVITMFVSSVIVGVCENASLMLGRKVCVRMKSIIIAEIYNKALRRRITKQSKTQADEDGPDLISHDEVSPQEVNDVTHTDGDEEADTGSLGQIINLMSVDALKVSELCAYLHFFLETFIMLTVALLLLYKVLGTASLLGIFLTLAVIPLNFQLYNYIGSFEQKSLEFTDKRIERLNESFQAIRIIKYFSWEDKFKDGIMKIRKVELDYLWQKCIVWSGVTISWFFTPTLITGCTFGYMIFVQKEHLSTASAFTALSLFTMLRDPLDMVSDMCSYLIQTKISLDRIQKFLESDETEKYSQLTVDPNGTRLSFENATITWDNEKDTFVLSDLNIEFKKGMLNVIIGPTGSGKTSILMGLLGEMQLQSGKIVVPSLKPKYEEIKNINTVTNSMAYCSQAAWLLNDSVKNNILFSNPYDEERYQAVVEACGLQKDFEILQAGDSTEIGEKGITLSGGQKQRVSLARALYSNAGYILLDDCLSAVDSHTAAWIYDKCITGPLMENRTCVLVTHNVALTMKDADYVIVIDDGKVKDQGSPKDLLAKGLLGDDESMKSTILSRDNSMVSLKTHNKLVKKLSKKKDISASPAPPQVAGNSGKLVEEEKKSQGFVSFSVYKWYIQMYGGWWTLISLASVFTIILALQISQAWWVRRWTMEAFPNDGSEASYISMSRKSWMLSENSFKTRNSKEEPKNPKNMVYYLGIYCLIGVSHSFIGGLKTLINSLFGLNASKKIFTSLLDRILQAKVRFFDATPTGRIMNRFSKDMEAVDEQLPPLIQGVFFAGIETVMTLMLISFITPQFTVVSFIIIVAYGAVGYFYLNTSRELKRLESITKSPIFQHFSETLIGISTIRAFGDELRFIKENLVKMDNNNMTFYYLWVVTRWLTLRVHIIGATVIFASGCFILLNIDSIDAGLAGISLTYAISFTEAAAWLVREYSDLDMNMNSVDRIQEYMKVEQEKIHATGDEAVAPPPNWPEKGKIQVTDLSLKYAPGLPHVIKNVSFTVDPKDNVGIVGRTGAGKSTIITALFRFLEADTGFIKLDDIDIANIDLTRLRRSITIIPQDPTLFAGSIRSNLDPYNEFDDEQIFTALKRVNLISSEELESSTIDLQSNTAKNINKFLNLENEITQGGSNFSQGQRQLMCLARSLLRMPKVILLDEATASIDYESDAKIQETIRTEFANSTVLTIAHRLRSIIDYDKILVMDAGEVKEYDHPYTLLLNKKSIFYNMCEHSGELNVLIELAKKSFISRLDDPKK
ncbi:ATP-dependent bile acid permease [Nakaseomyces bracarensis]|uniref:ATP-dependent bile acid permease n=1 Tax=Nakaseomyces bracarensis TaxID=273131 RepID=A0ABR4NSH9_9SACH